MKKEYLLVSSCLCGNNTKYNGKNNYLPLIEKIKEKYEIILICPEVMGGLSTPRNPSEICGDKVIMNDKTDVTANYNQGANIALALANKYNCTKALLKEKSPSCGVNKVYDGTFSNTLIEGKGITAKLLSQQGINIFSEHDILELLK